MGRVEHASGCVGSFFRFCFAPLVIWFLVLLLGGLFLQ